MRLLRRPLSVVVVLAALCSAAPCAAQTADARTPPDRSFAERGREEPVDGDATGFVAAYSRALGALAQGLVLWIGERTAYDIEPLLDRPPRIAFAAIGTVFELEGKRLEVLPGIHGAYGPGDNTLLLVLPWNIEGTYHRSILLHELVHAVQLSSREWRCLAETEWEAYQLQRLWLAERGIELAIDWLRIGMRSRCPAST